MSNAQIINGQQSTRTLAAAGAHGVTILVKVIAVSRESEAAQHEYSHLVSEIVSATNRQNAIGQVDLKSNDLEQIRLERDLKKPGYRYIRKRQSKGETRRADPKKYKAFVKKEELARAVGACLLDPFEVRLGVNRLFDEDLYSKIFDGRPAIDYLTFYRLFRIASHAGRGDTRYGYAKWLVMHFIWVEIGAELRRPALRANFLYAAERASSCWQILQPLEKASLSLFKAVLAFYRANKRTEEGVLLDPSLFFKYRGRQVQFQKFWVSRKTGWRATTKVQLDRFIAALKEVHSRPN